jgi:hypothetical protein
MYFKLKWFILFLAFWFLKTEATAQCPFQINNCKGRCPRFTDWNWDTYCDYTVIIETISKKIDTVVNMIPDTAKIAEVSKRDTFATVNKIKDKQGKVTGKNDVQGHEPGKSDLKDQAKRPGKTQPVMIPGTKMPVPPVRKPPIQQMKKYPVILLSSLSIGLYLISHLLTLFKILTVRIHRKIWNTILLITFIVSGFLGLFMVFQINYNFQLRHFRHILTWHVDFAIGMVLISVFHIIWHWNYLVKIFRYREVK